MEKRQPWTDGEKAAVLFQLIPQSIPWNTIVLPEGRTLKAVQVMIGKEKDKLKKAKAQGGEDGTPESEGGEREKSAPASGKKRKAPVTVDDKAKTKAVKTAKTKKTKVKDEPKEEEEGEEEDGEVDGGELTSAD